MLRPQQLKTRRNPVKTWIKKYILFSCLAMSVVLINACSLSEPIPNGNYNVIDQALQDSITANRNLKTNKKPLSPSIQNALMPELNIPLGKNLTNNQLGETESRFDIAVDSVPARDFFMGLVKDTPYNINISPQITGNISLALKGVTIPQTMDAVRDTYGFEYEKTSYGYMVFPRRLETKIFNINYIDVDRAGQSRTNVGSGQITNTIQNTLTSSGVSSSQQTGSVPSGTINTTSNSKFWELLKQNLETVIGTQEGRSVIVNPRSGAIIIKAYPNELRYVAQYLDGIQHIVHRQVIIEAKIIEVQLTAGFQNGINWKALGIQQGEVSSTNNNETDDQPTNFVGNITGVFSINSSGHGGAFSSVIKLLNSQGKVNVLSSPRIATINNQKAVIKVGQDRFFVTNVSSDVNTAVSSNSNNNVTQNVTLTPFFSGISLDVTPQIDENNFVTIHIHPIVSKVTKDTQTLKINDKINEYPLAKSVVKESDSIVRAKNGQVIVIGGLMESGINSEQDSTPIGDHLPGISGLFKSKNKTANKYELVILLRPVIAEDTSTWQKQLQDAAANLRKLRNTQDDFGYKIVPATPVKTYR